MFRYTLLWQGFALQIFENDEKNFLMDTRIPQNKGQSCRSF